MRLEQPLFQLQTPRLILRDLIEADWPLIYTLSLEPQVTRYQTWLRLDSEGHARQWVQEAIYHNHQQPRPAYNLALITRQDNQMVGWFGWGRPSDPVKGDYDFGYALQPAAWGRGYMTEALQAGLEFMFGSLGATSISGECAATNRASARVMEKAGLKLVAHWHECDAGMGSSEEHLRYAIQYADWLHQQG